MNLRTPSAVLEMLEAVGRAVADGRLDSRRAAALTQLGSACWRRDEGKVKSR